MKYQINFQTVPFVATENVPIIPDAQLEGTAIPLSQQCVTAENVVGVGAAWTCTTQTISGLLGADGVDRIPGEVGLLSPGTEYNLYFTYISNTIEIIMVELDATKGFFNI